MLVGEEKQITKWVADGLTVVKIGILLKRRGIVVPHRTLARFCVERCGAGRRTQTTVRVTDPPPGKSYRSTSAGSGSSLTATRCACAKGSIFTACLQPSPVRLADVLPDHRRGDQRIRSGMVLFRWRIPCGNPRQHEVDRDRGREHRAPVQRRVPRVRPVQRLRHRRGSGENPDRQATCRKGRAIHAEELLRR